MRVRRRFAATGGALISFAIGAACARPVEIAWDRREDLSRYRTWDWIDGDAVLVRAPLLDGSQVAAQLARLLERELAERGLSRAPGAGDLRVAADLVGTREIVTYRRPRPLQSVSSYHDIGGFEVQADQIERRSVDRCRVAIYFTAPHEERILWQGVSEREHADGCAGHVAEAVDDLLDRFPPERAVRAPR